MFSQVQTQEVKANTMYWCFGSRGTNASGQDELHVMNTLLCIRLITDVLVCIWLFHLVHLQKYNTSSLLKIEFNIQKTAVTAMTSSQTYICTLTFLLAQIKALAKGCCEKELTAISPFQFNQATQNFCSCISRSINLASACCLDRNATGQRFGCRSTD